LDVLRRLLKYVRPYWKALIGVSLLLLLNTGLALLPPLLQRRVVDQVIGAGDLSMLTVLIGALIVIHALSRVVDFGDLYLRHAIGARFIFDLRVRIY